MELEFIRWLREHVPNDLRAPLGLTDDAAVLSLADKADIVVTTDLLSDGVDFRLERDDPRRIGRKALAVNLSDLAAMAARPQAVVVSVALPRNPPSGMTSLELAIALYEGLLPLAVEFDVALAGGDTNTHDAPLVINVTALGQVTGRGPLTRGGGSPGDWLLVTGHLGGSILGHHFDFTPRIREAMSLHKRYELHAGMDLSDGLALDLARLAAESICGGVLFTEQIPISPAAEKLAEAETATGCHNREEAALQHALSDGEDFELLLAVPPNTAREIVRDQPLDCPIAHIGELTAGQALWLQAPDGQRRPLEPTGWTH